MKQSLKEVYIQLHSIKKTSSSNAKIALLEKYLKSGLFRRVCYLAYTSTIKFHIKKLPSFSPFNLTATSLDQLFRHLDILSKQTGASNHDKIDLARLASIDRETYEVVAKIVRKDLDCGVSAISINKARPGTIKKMPYQRCKTSAHINNILFEPEAMAQCKADGAFVNCFVEEDKIKFLTRSGQTVKQLEHLKKNMHNQQPKLKYGAKLGTSHNKHVWGKVYLGELRVWEVVGKKIMSRKKGNGIINQCIKGTANPEDAKKVFLTVWDCILSFKEFWAGLCDIAYNTRFFHTTSLVNAVANDKFVRLIEFKRITNLAEAYSFYVEMRAKDEEGAIIKNLNFVWKDHQSGSPDMIKLKHAFDCDLKFVRWNYGDEGGKWKNGVGSVTWESACGKLQVNVSGMTDEQREWEWDMMDESVIGCIEAESTSKSKNKDTYALYTPGFIEIRHDKTEANTLEEILEIEKESKKMKRRKA